MTPTQRLLAALLCYAALAGLATLTLDGRWRIFVWIFLGGLAVRTWVASKMERGS